MHSWECCASIARFIWTNTSQQYFRITSMEDHPNNGNESNFPEETENITKAFLWHSEEPRWLFSRTLEIYDSSTVYLTGKLTATLCFLIFRMNCARRHRMLHTPFYRRYESARFRECTLYLQNTINHMFSDPFFIIRKTFSLLRWHIADETVDQ